MLQQNNELENWNQDFKRIEYDYDLISGNVNEVVYQRGEFDEFYHRYRYDADNRLTRVETSRDGNIWDRDAKYYYYLHGPLARTEIGDKMVQGMDYAYTIHGWLKGVNSNSLRTDYKNDMGKDAHDGSTTTALYYSSNGWNFNNIHRHVAKDAFGFSLGYFNDGAFEDYKAIGTHGEDFIADINALNSGSAGNNLYNGNIRHMAVDLMNTSEVFIDGMAYVYQYDQLNRLKGMNAWDAGSGNFNGASNSSGAYNETYNYDANGNILNLTRNMNGGTTMDNLVYNYTAGTNKLDRVDDAVLNGVSTVDVDDQSAINYTYDEMGNLITDAQEEIDEISWNARGKISRITRNTGSFKPDLEFIYDASGQRIGKIVKPKNQTTGALLPQLNWTYTWYVKDAQGNTMAIYEQDFAGAIGGDPDDYVTNITLAEQTLYGSSRLGLIQQNIQKQSSFTANTAFNSYGEEVFTSLTAIVTPNYSAAHLLNGAGSRLLGNKRYELTNHLANVLAVVSDRKFGQQLYGYTANTSGTGTHTYNTLANEYVYVASGGNFDQTSNTNETSYDVYLPEVLSFSDYYPFHMQMPGRFDNSAGYRYGGSNGQEKETEITGNSSHYSAEYWMYDSRLGRRWNVDPVVKYHESPYAAFANNPIVYIDFIGADTTIANNKTGNLIIWYNYNNDKLDYDKIADQQAWDFIEVNDVKNIKSIVRDYLKANNLDLNNVVFKTHGSSALISAGYGNSERIEKEDIEKYINGESVSSKATRSLIMGFEYIGKKLKSGGNFVITACKADRKDGELGYALGNLLLKRNKGSFNLYLNGDTSGYPTGDNGDYIYFDNHSLTSSGWSSHSYGWSVYKMGYYWWDTEKKMGKVVTRTNLGGYYIGLDGSDKKNPFDRYTYESFWNKLGF
jgi:hypothetical protein